MKSYWIYYTWAGVPKRQNVIAADKKDAERKFFESVSHMERRHFKINEISEVFVVDLDYIQKGFFSETADKVQGIAHRTLEKICSINYD